LDYNNSNTTIAAIATPEGVGAVGLIRLSGPDAINIADRIFKGKKLSQQKSHSAHLGKILDEQSNTLDEVLATVFVVPIPIPGNMWWSFPVMDLSICSKRYWNSSCVRVP
jgi:tRNA U34 5-carboxymethylaminomethyl modifying GTPase MnmE/TrmE